MKGHPHLDYIPALIRKLETSIDEILWETSHDPRLEGLVQELTKLKEKEAKGELYEPRF